jgi:hypothetical protein
LKNLLAAFRKNLHRTPNGDGTAEAAPFDLDAQIACVAEAEAERDAGLGRRIYQFRYRDLDLRLDRDVLGRYRVTASEGPQRRFSFTVLCDQGDYAALRDGFAEITRFLDGERRVRDLPRHDRLQGHYYGT